MTSTDWDVLLLQGKQFLVKTIACEGMQILE